MPTPDSLTRAHSRLNAWRDRALDDLVQGAGVQEPGTTREVALPRSEARRVRSFSLEIDLAFVRLAHGRYGVCEGCGAAIADEQLDIQPAAIRCAACQAAWDRAAHH
ncbi:MAG: TraR/DksA C4-type zinc finger protein [Proteobacteria bacterium]|nr:TraR/DksA C4-type zinc finger protein [Pseudomonadota bacterium]